MDEREKVIKGLELCRIPACGEEKCPYYRQPGCRQYLRLDALELLRPHLMTLDEIIALEPDNNLVWIERKDIPEASDYGRLYRYYPTGSQYPWDEDKKRPYFDFENMGIEVDYYMCPEDLNKLWRCWTGKPTKEQREAAKWE